MRTNQKEYREIERAVTGLGYEFVHLEWVPRSGLLRIYIDKPGGIGLNDCSRVSDHLSRVLAVEVVTYERLEVSSPGLDRPLAREQDFKRFAGQRARVWLRVPVAGRKSCTGILGEFADGAISIVTDDKSVLSIDFANVEKARLVPSL